MNEAIDHALAAGDLDRAAELIEHEAEPTLMRSEAATLLHWIAALPDRLVQTRSTLLFYDAWARVLSGQPLGEEELQQRAALITEPGAHIELLRAAVALMQGRITGAILLARQASTHLPQHAPFLQSIAAWLLSIARLSDGDATGAAALKDMIEMAQQSGNIATAVLGLCRLADLRVRQARLREAEALNQRALELALDDDGQPRPIACEPLMGLGDIARERNQLETAQRYLQQGIELAKQWRAVGAQRGLMALAVLHQAQGDSARATAAMQEAAELAQRSELTEIDDLTVVLMAAQLAIRQGDLAAAERWAEARGLTGQSETIGTHADRDWIVQHLRKYEWVTFARLRLAQRRYAEGLELLDTWLPKFDRIDRAQTVISIEIYRALALHGLNRRAEALAALEHALSLAEPEGYARVFLDEGEPMRLLIADFRVLIEKRQPDPAARNLAQYAAKLLAAFSPPDVTTAIPQISNQQSTTPALHQTQRGASVNNLIEPLSRARTGNPAPHRRRIDQSRDRRSAGAVTADRQMAHRQSLRQTRRQQPHASGGEGARVVTAYPLIPR